MASRPPDPDQKPEYPFVPAHPEPKGPPVRKKDGGHGPPPHNQEALIYP